MFMLLGHIVFGCMCTTAALGTPVVKQVTIRLTNNNSSAKANCTIKNFDGDHYLVSYSKQYFGQYEELVSWGLELSQKYKNNANVLVEMQQRNDYRFGSVTDYCLTINNVTLDDYAAYICRVYRRQNDSNNSDNDVVSENGFNFQENLGYFSNNYPVCASNLPTTTLISGTEVILTCSHSGVPPLLVEWFGANGTKVGESVRDIGPSNVTQIAYNQLQVTLQEKDNGATFTCKVTSSSGTIERQCTIGPFNISNTTDYLNTTNTEYSSTCNISMNMTITNTVHSDTTLFVVIAVICVVAVVSVLLNVFLSIRLRRYKIKTKPDDIDNTFEQHVAVEEEPQVPPAALHKKRPSPVEIQLKSKIFSFKNRRRSSEGKVYDNVQMNAPSETIPEEEDIAK